MLVLFPRFAMAAGVLIASLGLAVPVARVVARHESKSLPTWVKPASAATITYGSLYIVVLAAAQPP